MLVVCFRRSAQKTDSIIVADWAISFTDIVAVAAKAKLDCAHWEKVRNERDLQATGFDEISLPALSRILLKLWPFKYPTWVASIRDRVLEMKALRAKAQTPEKKASAAIAPDTASEPESAAVAPATAASAPAPPMLAKFVVGDIVRLGSKVGKGFTNEEAQVTNVHQKSVAVTLLTGQNKNQIKTSSYNHCLLIHPSTLRTLGSGATAAAAPATETAAVALATEMEEQRKVAEQKECEDLAATLLNSDDEIM